MPATLTPDAVQPRPSEVPIEQLDLDRWVGEVLNRNAAVGFAVAVVRDGRLAHFASHGLADIDSGTPITRDTVFRIASITKTMTAIAVMQLWEEGLVELDAPANDYLRAFRLIPGREGAEAATLRHLLTHTAGIPEVVRASDLLRPDWGDSIALDEPLPTLAEVYGHGIRLHGEPGTTFTYSNHGFATLQQIVEDVSGRPFDRHLRERIFQPLGMADTDLLRTERLAARLATGYVPGANGPRRVTDRAWVTPGASSVYSTTADMARYVGALAGGGSNEHGSILRPETLASMFAPHFQGDPRVPGMGLGFDRADTGGRLVVGHGGILPGFNSQMFAAPESGAGVIAWTTGARLAMLWLPTETGRLVNRLIGVPDDVIRTDVPQRPETWQQLCGHYGFSGRLTDIRSRMMTGFGADVYVSGGKLMLRLRSPVPGLLRGLELHPDSETDPDVFRIDLARFGLPTARIVFSPQPGVGATAMHLGIFPMSLRRRPAERRRPKVWHLVALSTLTSVAATLVARRMWRRAPHRTAQGRTR
jgi:CubicO group peptidase (beta-lactamase class C family)